MPDQDDQIIAIQTLIRRTPRLLRILEAIRDLELPDAWLVSGGIYQTVWNDLTGRPFDHGIKDYDVIYFDDTDRSYEAEDRVIKQVSAALPDLEDIIETRNQARIHLWYEQRFGSPYPQLSHAVESLSYYAAKTHAVAARLLETGEIEIYAPFGLDTILQMRLEPNYALNNQGTYEKKAVRMKKLWPELTVIPWSETATA